MSTLTTRMQCTWHSFISRHYLTKKVCLTVAVFVSGEHKHAKNFLIPRVSLGYFYNLTEIALMLYL